MTKKNQRGQILVTAAVGLVLLLGFAGLGVDVGVMRYQRRLEQTAADGAAVAGAVDLSFGFGATTGAQGRASQNGYTDNNAGAGCVGGAVGCVSVAVNNGPATGPHAGNSKYVEVIVTQVQPTYFMKIFGINSKPVSARAVATNVSGGANSGCLYTLGKPGSAIQGVGITGAATLNAPNCGIVDNGNFDPTGGAYTVNANTFAVSGACSGSGCGSVSSNVNCTGTSSGSPCPSYSAPATQDPLVTMVPPTQPAKSASCPASGACDVSTSGTVTLQPGTYSSIDIGKNSTVTMASGIYYINGSGGLNFNGGGTLTSAAGGVLIYFTGSATLTGRGGANQPDINLSPMTTGPYAGVTFYQDRNDTATPSLGGDNNSTFSGILYFPSVQLTFFGNNTTYATGTVIADSIAITGSPVVNLGNAPGGAPGTSILTTAVLVE